MVDFFITDICWENPWKNLAYEKCLLEYVDHELNKDHAISGLYLWQNNNTIVIGRNQNPLRECNMDYVKRHNIKIARRLTGGGAVYHDMGNLNYSFITPKAIYNKNQTFDMLLYALKNLGITAELSGRNDILLDGKKISGNAFYDLGQVSLHHGTLLIASDNRAITESLTPDHYKLRTKGISSVNSRIASIKQYHPGISIGQVKEQLTKAFSTIYLNNGHCIEASIDWERLSDLTKEFSSSTWIMGTFSKNFYKIEKEWGILRVHITEKKGNIEKIFYETDSLEVALLEKMFKKLEGIPLTLSALKNFEINFSKNYNKNQKNIIRDIIKVIIELLL